MQKIAVVDDNKADRYTIKRRLSKMKLDVELIEFDSGDAFLRNFFEKEAFRDKDNLLVIMDINMPRLNGFETVGAMQQCLKDGKGIRSCVVMMFSSSDNPVDREMAENYDIIAGYIVKPLDIDDAEMIRGMIS